MPDPDTVEHVCICDDCSPEPFVDRCQFEERAERAEARNAAAGWVQLTKWTCPHGHLFWVDDMTPKQCPDCGTSTLRKPSTERSNNDD